MALQSLTRTTVFARWNLALRKMEKCVASKVRHSRIPRIYWYLHISNPIDHAILRKSGHLNSVQRYARFVQVDTTADSQSQNIVKNSWRHQKANHQIGLDNDALASETATRQSATTGAHGIVIYTRKPVFNAVG
jgi:hypothetical protein